MSSSGDQAEIQNNQLNFDATPFNSQNDTSSIILLSDGRKKYKDETINRVLDIAKNYDVSNIPFGDLYEENVLYGILDLDNDVVLPKTEFIVKANNKTSLQDFCNLALKEMSDYLQNVKTSGKIISGFKYDNLNIQKSFFDVNEMYLLIHAAIAKTFREITLSNKQENSLIIDHKVFVKKYIQFLITGVSKFPLTKSQSVLGMNFLQYTSGMMFSIDIADAGDDIKKYKDYLLSPNFLLFADTCKRFGFKIDKNMPWLLYADLNSPAMLGTTGNHTGYLTRYGINNIKDLFEKRFYKVYGQDLSELKKSFYNAYNIFLSNGNDYYQESDRKLCSRDAKQNNVYKRNSISEQKFYDDFPDTFWIRLYVYFRNLETRKGLTQDQFEVLSNEAAKYIKFGLLENALSHVNSYFKDYNYINYVSSLQPRKEMLQLPVSNSTIPNLVF